MSSRLLLVAGIVTYEHLIYPMPVEDGIYENGTRRPIDDNEDVSHMVVRTGGADLVARLLTAAAAQHGLEVLGPVPQPSPSSSLKQNASAVISLQSLSLDEPLPKYSVAQVRRIGRAPAWHSPQIDNSAITPSSTVIITGSGAALRDVEPALDFLLKSRPRFIVHHMSRPLATGPLWDLIRNGPLTRDGIPDPDFLAVVVDADDLRAEGIALSQSLSWEATAEDFVRNLGSNGRLDTLVTCPNLIVRFGNEGVIHHRGRDAVDPKLYFHPRKMWEGKRPASAQNMVCTACQVRS